VGEIAYHWHRAGDPVRAMPATLTAAAAAEGIRAMAEARDQYARALELWPLAAAAATRARDAVVRAAAAAAYEVWDVGWAIRLLREELASTPAPAARAGLLVDLSMYEWLTSDPRSPDTAEAATVAAREAADPELLAAALTMVAFVDGTAAGAAAAREATTLAAQAGDLAAESWARSVLASALAVDLDPAAAAEHERAVELAFAAGHVSYQGRSLLNRSAGLNGLGRYREGLAAALEAIAFSRERGQFTLAVIAEVNAAEAEYRLGQWDRAADRIGAMRAILRRHGTSADTTCCLDTVLARRGHPDATANLLKAYTAATRAWVKPDDAGFTAAGLVEAIARDGAPDDALALAEEALAALSVRIPRHAAELLATALGIAADAGRTDRADALAEAVSRLEASLSHRTPEVDAFLQQAKAEHARAAGRDATATWVGLAASWQRMENPYATAYARFRAAGATLSGSPTTLAQARAEAAELLRDAALAAERLGAVFLLDDIRLLARSARIELAVETPSEPSRDDDSGLTARERDVLRLIAGGYSNGEIAGRLYITTKTASTHVSNILRKLDATNRVQAATIAHRRGLAP
jgi:DNA-binding CsgD family transcriptional regulator